MKKFALLFAFAFFACGANAYQIKKTEEGKPLQGKRTLIIDINGKVLSGGATQQASPATSAASAPQNAAKGLSGGGASAAEAAKQTTAAMAESPKGPGAVNPAAANIAATQKDMEKKLKEKKATSKK